MSNVIYGDFISCKDGYIMNGSEVEGVYVGDLAATSIDKDLCVIGFKDGDDKISGYEVSIEDINQFCLMWLCIFNEAVIAKDVDNKD